MGQRLCFGARDMVHHALATDGDHTNEARSAYVQPQFQARMFEFAHLERHIDAEFQKLGLRGATIIAASGDGALHFAQSGNPTTCILPTRPIVFPHHDFTDRSDRYWPWQSLGMRVEATPTTCHCPL